MIRGKQLKQWQRAKAQNFNVVVKGRKYILYLNEHMVALIYARWQIDTQTWCPLAEPEGGKGGHLSPWLLLNFFSNSSLNSKVVTFWHGGKKKNWKKGLLLGWKWPNHCFCLVLLQLSPISLFFILYHYLHHFYYI